MQLKTKLINLWKIRPEKVYVMLNDNFRRDMFSKLIDYSSLNRFSEKYNINKNTLQAQKSGKVRLNLKDLKRLINFCEIELNLVKIKDISYGSKIKYKNITIPSKVSIDLCRIAGHLCGDGGLSINTGLYTVYYANKEKNLINNFRDSMYCLFRTEGNEQYTNNIFQISYDSLIGLMLWSIFGNMSNEDKHIPKIILNSNKRFKAEFIKSLFDDEASVRLKEHKIEIKLANEDLIKSLKELLMNLGIKTGEYKEHSYYRKIKNKKQFRIIISGRKNILNYYKNIGFNHIKKIRLLKETIESYKYTHYTKEDFKKIIPDLLNKNKELTMVKIAKKIGRKPHSQLNKILMDLVKNNKINLKK